MQLRPSRPGAEARSGSEEPTVLSRAHRLPTILAFTLLTVQVVMPWTTPTFVTQDGPSHLYTARVLGQLVVDPGGPYGQIYRINDRLSTNWGAPVVLNLLVPVVGTARAEAALTSLCVLLGFFGLGFLMRSSGAGSPWSPWLNVAVGVWLLWVGFYSVVLGMALALFLLGFVVRQPTPTGWGRTTSLSLALLLLFFVHVFAAFFAALGTAALVLWRHVLCPAVVEVDRPIARVARSAIRPLGTTALALLPCCAVLAVFVTGAPSTGRYDPELTWALSSFPMHILASSHGPFGEQDLLKGGLVLYLWIGLFSLSRREWAGPAGGLASGAGVAFVLYLLVPDGGFGGGDIKIRFAWGVVLLGLAAVAAASRLTSLRSPVAVLVACLFLAHLVHTWRVNVLSPAAAVQEVRSAMRSLPDGSSYIRLARSTAATRSLLGFGQAGFSPLFHADSGVAADRGLVALSDYQAASEAFPVVFAPQVPVELRSELRSIERPDEEAPAALRRLLASSLSIDHLVVVGDPGSVELHHVVSGLPVRLRLLSDRTFVQVFRIDHGSSPDPDATSTGSTAHRGVEPVS